MWYNVVMAVWLKEWAIPLSAGATFLLAVAAFWAIWQTRKLQKRERRERLLNEIIEWGEDIAKCGVKDNKGSEVWSNFAARYFDKVHVTNIKVEDFLREKFIIEFSRAADFLFTFTVMKGKSHYISRASLSLGQELQNAVLSLTRDLEMHIELIMNYLKDIRSKLNSIEEVTNQELIQEDSNNYIEEIGNHKEQLDLLAYKVIEMATKIKTKDIG